MQDKLSWIITATGDRPVGELVDDLRKAGLVVGNLLAEIGVVTGRCTNDQAVALRKVAGVADVTPDAPVGIDPVG
jgi:hypothetical protein